MELSKCNLDLTIQKSTLVNSEIRGFGFNIIFLTLQKWSIFENREVRTSVTFFYQNQLGLN